MKKTALVLLLLVAGVALTNGFWIHAKAMLAQYLIADAWEKQNQGMAKVKPWSWADTWPVARLQVPELGVDQFVLAGASGRVLAFGPGHLRGTASPGSRGNTVISGHRDTHFRWLKDLKEGDRIRLGLPGGTQIVYAVETREVISQQDTWILQEQSVPLLRLLTCYPFDTVVPGGAQRYVVTAVPASAARMF